MDGLSPELLTLIAGHLDRRSLESFSLTSQTLRSISLPYVLNTVTVKFASPETLNASVSKAIEVLQGPGGFKHVRHLRVVARDLISMHTSFPNFYDNVFDRPLAHWKYTNPRRTALLDTDSHWQSLSYFINILSGLREVTWACAEQIPIYILRHLHTLTPRCRLHMHCFDLQSLSHDGLPSTTLAISPNEREIATSPCLYSLTRRIVTSGFDDHNLKAILEMVSGGAPNLKGVCLAWEGWYNGFGLMESAFATTWPRQAWRPGTIQPSRPCAGSLESIVLIGTETIPAIRKLRDYTDFGLLKELKLYTLPGRYLIPWLIDNCNFGHLEHLTVGWPYVGMVGEVSRYRTSMLCDSLITASPPLRDLCLHYYHEPNSMHNILSHCAHHLRVLHCVSNFVDVDMLARLARSCPRLEELAISMTRQAGSPEELAIYRSLGSIPALEKVSLCFHAHRGLPSYRIIAMTPELIDHCFHALRDLAMDKPLAKMIYRAIASSKPPDASPFQSLQLRTNTGLGTHEPHEADTDIELLLTYVGRSLRCTRTSGSNDGQVNGCMVEVYDVVEELERQALDADWCNILTRIMNTDYAPAVHRVWPETWERPMESVWHAFPLYEEV